MGGKKPPILLFMVYDFGNINMNDRNKILQIIRHPVIKRILEARMATTSEVARLVAEEVMGEQELGQKKYEGQVEQLTRLVTSKKYANFSGAISKFLETKPKGREAFVANMGKMDPQQLLEILGNKNEWFKDKKVQIEKEAKAGKLDYAAFLLQGEFKKWEAQYKEAYEAYNTATGASETGNPDQQSYNKFRAIVLVWQDMFKSAVTLIKAAQDAEDKSGDREEINECIKILSMIIKQILEETKKNKKAFAEVSEYFIKLLEKSSLTSEEIDEAIKALEPFKDSLETLDEEIEKFKNRVKNDPECKKQFGALEEKDKEVYIIGKFLINYKNILKILKKTEPEEEKEDCIALLKNLIEMFTSKYNLDEKAFAELTVKIFEVYAFDQKFANDEEKKNILEKFNSTLKPFIKEFSEKIDKFVKMYNDNTEECKGKVDNLKETDVPKYKIAMFFIEYREILEKMGTPPPDSAPTPETIELEKDAIDNYIANFNMFCTKFLNVKTLHQQSEIFRAFYSTVFPIAGINPDTIVGDQLSAYTRTAATDLKITDDEVDPNLNEAEGDEEQPQRQLTKDISQNAKVIERHANAILEILEGYEKYLNISDDKGKRGRTGGVEQGSRILFKKFGESNPRKLLYKFVKLIVKDIDSTISIMDDMISQANRASGTEQLNEAEVDNSVRDLPVRDKIILVIKTGKKICDIGERLKDMIAKTETDGQKKEREAAEKANQPQQQQTSQDQQQTSQDQQQTSQDQEAATKRDDIREAETADSDARINADPTGTDSDPRDLRTMQARQGDEIQIGYKKLAKQIYDLMNKIRPLFPTSQPFDTNYDFSVAMETFKAALTGLSSHVAQVSGFEFDQVTSADVLSSFKQKLVGFKKVIKDVFGFGKETKDSKNQASFNKEGKNSGMPHAGEDDDDKGSSNTQELNKKLKKVLEDYQKSHYLIRLIMTTGYKEEFEEQNSLIFEPLQSSQQGKVTKSIENIKTSNTQQTRSLDLEEKKIESEIENASENNYNSSYQKLEDEVITWLKRIINSQDIMTMTEEEKNNTGERARIRQVGESMIKAMSLYFLMKRVSEKIDEGLEIQEKDIKEMDNLIKEFKKNMRLMTTILNRYPIKKDLEEKSRLFYKNFHRFKIPGFTPTGKKPKNNKPDSGGDEGDRRRPPKDTETEKEETGSSQKKQRTRRQAATNESVLANKLKPLIREMLNKGK
jgi:hypothetical protein